MRLFVGGYPPPEACAHLLAALPERDQALRWGDPAQWHVTLAFLGEIGAERLPDLRDRLTRAAARSVPSRLRLERGGSFRGGVLWVGVAGDTRQLGLTAARVAAAARRTGVALPPNRFRPHLTLARSRGRGQDQGSVAAAAATLRDYRGPEWALESFRLVRSHLGPPLVHEPLEDWELGG